MAREMVLSDIIRFLKANPAFVKFQEWIDEQLEKERENYETVEVSEFLRGRVSILKHLKSELEK